MYYLRKEISISSAHSLKLPYDSKCKAIHGHNWRIVIYLKREDLNEQGMIYDFSEIKRLVNEFDHAFLNEADDFKGERNTSAEIFARILCQKIPYCYRVEIHETEGNMAAYEEP